jgi:ribosome-associated heat shock protein Hsp15
MGAAADEDEDDAGGAHGTQRIDKWLWFARITKSRTLAAQMVADGKVRVNRVRAAKPSQVVRSGDVLTVTVRGQVDIFQVLAPGERRGPPAEAQQLYKVLTPPGTGNPRPVAPSAPKERRSSKEKDQERNEARSAKRDRRMG